MSKTCTACGVSKDLDSFYLQKGKHQAECKDCLKLRRSAYYKANKELVRNRVAASTYGISVEEVEALKSRGCCDICGSDGSDFTKGLHIDHCHTTGKVRGILCHSCNTGLGAFKDNTDLLQKAKDYLNV